MDTKRFSLRALEINMVQINMVQSRRQIPIFGDSAKITLQLGCVEPAHGVIAHLVQRPVELRGDRTNETMFRKCRILAFYVRPMIRVYIYDDNFGCFCSTSARGASLCNPQIAKFKTVYHSPFQLQNITGYFFPSVFLYQFNKQAIEIHKI